MDNLMCQSHDRRLGQVEQSLMALPRIEEQIRNLTNSVDIGFTTVRLELQSLHNEVVDHGKILEAHGRQLDVLEAARLAKLARLARNKKAIVGVCVAALSAIAAAFGGELYTFLKHLLIKV
jgi:hypothetical protein